MKKMYILLTLLSFICLNLKAMELPVIDASQSRVSNARGTAAFTSFSQVVQDEAERLVEIMLISPLNLHVSEPDKNAIAEIRARLEKKFDTLSSDPIVTKALEILTEMQSARNPNGQMEEQQPAARLLEEALHHSSDDIPAGEDVDEVFNVIRRRAATPTKDVHVKQALELYNRREATKSRFLTCAREGMAGELQQLINNGINLDEIRDYDGNTGLALAVENGKLSTAKLLLDAGAKSNTANNVGLTPRDIAVNRNNKAMLSLLSAAKAPLGADLTKKEEDLFKTVSSQDLFLRQQGREEPNFLRSF